MKGLVKIIDSKIAINFLLPKHYSGRKPQISKAFGLYDNDKLVAVCTFGKPASNSLCKGICGEKFSKNVYELNRLCRIENWDYPLSSFVSKCLKMLKPYDWIIVSYADTGMHHNGYIYQACSFLYTGKTKERTDKYTEGNKHSRHYSNNNQDKFRKIRTSKHRYVKFCTYNKKLLLEMKFCLNYDILPYPKEKNENYILGDFQKPILVEVNN